MGKKGKNSRPERRHDKGIVLEYVQLDSTGRGHRRSTQFQMRQNGSDDIRISDIRDHPQRAAAERTNRNIDIKNALEPLTL